MAVSGLFGVAIESPTLVMSNLFTVRIFPGITSGRSLAILGTWHTSPQGRHYLSKDGSWCFAELP